MAEIRCIAISYAFVKLKADIYDNTKHEDAQFEWINTFDSTWVVSNTVADFGGMVANAFDELYRHSIDPKNTKANVRYQQSTGKFTGSKEEIIAKLKRSSNHPILKDSVYADGIYTTFNEFKDNAPAITRFYATTNDNDKAVKLYQLMPDSSSRLIEKPGAFPLITNCIFIVPGNYTRLKNPPTAFT